MSNNIVQLTDYNDNNIYPIAGAAAQGSITKTMLEEGVFEGPELSQPSSVAYVATDNIQDRAVTSDKIDWETIVFNTISDMISNTTLSDGAYAQTYGFYSQNDGGGARYLIRSKTNADVVDSQQIIQMDDSSLVAELIKTEPINVKQCGVHGDGVTDDTTLIQNLMDTDKQSTLYFPKGEYLISSPLIIRSANADNINLHFEDDALLMTSTTITSLIEIGNNSTGSYNRYAEGSICTIQGGVLDASNTTQAIKITSNKKQTVIKDMTIINISNYGIYTATGSDSSSSTDNVLTNLSINGLNTANSSVGIYLGANDDKLSHIRINACKTAIVFAKSGHTLEDIHPLGSWNTGTPSASDYAAVKGFIFLSGSGGIYTMTNIYMDTMSTCFEINETNLQIMISNLTCFWWLKNASYTTTVIAHNAVGNQRFLIQNAIIELPTIGTVKGIDLSGTNTNYRNFFPSFETYALNSVIIKNQSILDIEDYILCKQIYTDSPTYQADWWQAQMTAGNYYPIAKVKNLTTMRIQANQDQIIEATVSPDNNTMVIRNICSNSNSGVYSLALCDAITNSDGVKVAILCVKCSTTRPCNISITNYKGGTGQLFTRRGYSTTALTNPTVNIEASFNP